MSQNPLSFFSSAKADFIGTKLGRIVVAEKSKASLLPLSNGEGVDFLAESMFPAFALQPRISDAPMIFITAAIFVKREREERESGGEREGTDPILILVSSGGEWQRLFFF